MTFGDLLSNYRKQAGLTLRDFSKLVGYDSSNISKVERGVLPPPPASIVLRKWALALGLRNGSPEENDFVSTGLSTRVGQHIKSDSELDDLMPAFFRTVGNRKIDPETYEKLKMLLRKNT